MKQAIFAAMLYCILIVATAPASVLAWILTRTSGSALAIEQPQGGLWVGSASAVTYTDATRRLHRHERVSWNFTLSQLWQDELCATIHVEDRSLRGTARVAVGPQGLRIDKIDFASPASVFAEYLPAAIVGPLSGDLSLRSEDIRLHHGAVFGEATVTWRNAGSALQDANPWGDYVARITGVGDAIEVRVETLAGVIYIAGTGTWSSSKGGVFVGRADALPGTPTQIADSLKILVRTSSRERSAFGSRVSPEFEAPP
jgi:hypothetical protein